MSRLELSILCALAALGLLSLLDPPVVVVTRTVEVPAAPVQDQEEAD